MCIVNLSLRFAWFEAFKKTFNYLDPIENLHWWERTASCTSLTWALINMIRFRMINIRIDLDNQGQPWSTRLLPGSRGSEWSMLKFVWEIKLVVHTWYVCWENISSTGRTFQSVRLHKGAFARGSSSPSDQRIIHVDRSFAVKLRTWKWCVTKVQGGCCWHLYWISTSGWLLCRIFLIKKIL